MRRKGIALVGLVVAIAVVLGVALAARGGSPKRPAFTPPAASKQFGDDADLMRRLERKKLTTRSHK